MPSGFRTPRTLASWFELDYFRRRALFRRLWGGLPVLAGLAAVFALGAMYWAAGHRAFQAGPLSTPHAMFNDRCDVCHDRQGATLSRMWHGDSAGSVSDDACRKCHEGSHHHERSPVGRCVACHKEHRGHAALVRIDDRKCVECHRDLSGITSFAVSQHPPFRETTDPGTLRFNHQAHLGSPKVEPRLDCSDCHKPDAAGRYMQPVAYEAHCARCHPITVRLGGEQSDTLPHPRRGGSADDVRAALRDRLARFIAAPGRERLLKAKEEEGRLPLPASAAREDREFAWVGREAAELGRVVFDGAGGCRYCHAVTPTGGLPVIAAPATPDRWRKQATFRHDAHRMMRCEECHDARGSARTSDVLLPRMEVCLTCHDRSAKRGTARADCVECHAYHDPMAPRAPVERRTIDEILKGWK
jgi:predicted CXXCH cytochrome family protein